MRADREAELLEEQVEQLTLALGHTARQKADGEARTRLLEQVRAEWLGPVNAPVNARCFPTGQDGFALLYCAWRVREGEGERYTKAMPKVHGTHPPDARSAG